MKIMSTCTRRSRCLNCYHSAILAAITVLLLLTMPTTFSSNYAVTTMANPENDSKGRGERNSLMSLARLPPFLHDEKKEKVMGAYVPDKMHLEDMEKTDQKRAVSAFLEQGFDEYYFVMHDFENAEEVKATEKLLDAADKTELKIVIILLPPSEGGPVSNYDWKEWINYFNDLKNRHPFSFDGFAIDDFNWISTRNDTKFWRNIDFMLYSNLSKALEGKRNDLKFYPVVYFEGLGTDVVVDEYGKFAESIILVSASYFNVSKLEDNLSEFRKIFKNKPIDYIVYPTITYNYTRQDYDPPSDRLVMATLSIATRMVDGIIIWHKIDSHVVQDYLRYREDPNYLQAIYAMEQLQIVDEKVQDGREN